MIFNFLHSIAMLPTSKLNVLRLKVLNGLDVVELGAVLGALPEAFANDGEGKKAAWRDGVQAKLKELAASEARGTLPRSLARHPAYGGLSLGPLDPSAPLPRRAAVASGCASRRCSTPQRAPSPYHRPRRMP